LALAAVTGLLAAQAVRVDAQVGKAANPPLLNPNLASVEELQKVPQITSQIAAKIVASRPLLKTADLDKVLADAGLTAEQRTEAYRRVFLHINLNKATNAEIRLIPGVGSRIAHEFEEYRPYKSLEQFRKEIGKYVDEKEVARLEQYVFIPVNLNTASDESIMSIPGLGKRMLHEFKEYRPYKNIQQFRKEIGKYVDEKEVARLESYVTLD
jgi:DNA uptake protein ComE-like DNA-binding protein